MPVSLIRTPWSVEVSLLLLLAAAALSVHAQTKMFKCVHEGRTVYQQSGCPVTQAASEAVPAATSVSLSASAVPRIKKN
jgi:hypothetical protein